MAPRPIARVDIPAHNREELSKFYHDLFGWKVEPGSTAAAPWIFESGSISGGFPAIDTRTKVDEVTIYVASEDVEVDLKEAEGLGATRITGKTTLAGQGEYAIFRDPSGNRIALWKRLQG